MLTRILALIHKETLAVWRDKKSRLVLDHSASCAAARVCLCGHFGRTKMSIGILNRDNGAQGIELVERFRGSPTIKQQLTFLQAVEEIAPFIDNQTGVMVVSLDEQFSRNLEAGNKLIFNLF